MTPGAKIGRAAMTANGFGGKAVFDHRDHLAGRAFRSQCRQNRRPRHGRQIAQVIYKGPEILRFHAMVAQLRITARQWAYIKSKQIDKTGDDQYVLVGRTAS